MKIFNLDLQLSNALKENFFQFHFREIVSHILITLLLLLISTKNYFFADSVKSLLYLVNSVLQICCSIFVRLSEEQSFYFSENLLISPQSHLLLPLLILSLAGPLSLLH